MLSGIYDLILKLVYTLMILGRTAAALHAGSIVGDRTTCRSAYLHDDPEAITMDCRSRSLTTLPVDTHPRYVVDLDVSGNHFEALPQFAFSELRNLSKLNISQCGIRNMSTTTFTGLHRLLELDMKNNPIIGLGLPHGLFDDLVALTTLSISGYIPPKESEPLPGKLAHLEEITLTTGAHMPYALDKLPNIQRVYLVFCKLGTLTRSLLQTLSNTAIKELAVIACDINHIENETFDGFAFLKVLNFGGNVHLNVDHVIDVLSNSKNLSVSTLILDLAGSRIFGGKVMLGQHEHHGCRSAWGHIKKLSIRGIILNSISPAFQHCLPKLKAFAGGFNAMSRCGRSDIDCTIIVTTLLRHVEYLDMSYFNVVNGDILRTLSGFVQNDNWIKQNDDYFPQLSEFPSSCTDGYITHSLPYVPASNGNITNSLPYVPASNGNTTRPEPAVPSCHVTFPFLHCLSYIRIDHGFLDLLYTKPDSQDTCFIHSSLQYINVSNWFSVSQKPVLINQTFHGLFEHAEVIDVSGCRLSYIKWNSFEHSDALRVFNLARNVLGMFPFVPFPALPGLEDLDLSHNEIKAFNVDVFASLTYLRYLNISWNQLTSLDVLIPKTLHILDASNNQLISLESSFRTRLDARPEINLYLDSNPIQCDCSQLAFIAWHQTTSTNIHNKQEATCQQGGHIQHMSAIDRSHMKVNCGTSINKGVISIVTCIIFTMVIIAGVLTYRYRWLIKWRLYKLRYVRRHNREDNVVLQDPDQDGMHSAYVIYPEDDDSVRSWVVGTLRQQVEDELHKPSMFIRARDEYGGDWQISELVRGLQQSQTAIWIICPAFFQDKNCETAANFALHELGTKNNLLIILENRFQCYSVPKQFANVMNSSLGIPRIRYTENEEGRELFWAKLDLFLPSWTYEHNN